MVVAEEDVISLHEKCGQRRAWVAAACAVVGTRHLGYEPLGELVVEGGDGDGLRDSCVTVGCHQGCR